jgi:hypothetical protein
MLKRAKKLNKLLTNKIGLSRLRMFTFKNVEFFIYLKKFKGTSSTPTFFFCFPVIYILKTNSSNIKPTPKKKKPKKKLNQPTLLSLEALPIICPSLALPQIL